MLPDLLLQGLQNLVSTCNMRGCLGWILLGLAFARCLHRHSLPCTSQFYTGSPADCALTTFQSRLPETCRALGGEGKVFQRAIRPDLCQWGKTGKRNHEMACNPSWGPFILCQRGGKGIILQNLSGGHVNCCLEGSRYLHARCENAYVSLGRSGIDRRRIRRRDEGSVENLVQSPLSHDRDLHCFTPRLGASARQGASGGHGGDE